MKALVIGSSGQLARSLLGASPVFDVSIAAVGRPEVDLENSATLIAAFDKFKPDVVINGAAYTAVDKAETEPELAKAINALGVEQLALLCERHEIPLVHVSTDYVFDGANPDPYIETDAVSPLGVYGQTKLLGEQLVAQACTRHIILRTSWVYSDFGNNFLKTMLRLGESRNSINVVADQFGCPTYAFHLADAIFSIVEQISNQKQDSAVWGIYHACGTGHASWFDFAGEIFAQAKSLGRPAMKVNPITTAQYPTPARRPANSRLDCSKLDKTFGIRLPDWHAGTAQCVRALVDGRG